MAAGQSSFWTLQAHKRPFSAWSNDLRDNRREPTGEPWSLTRNGGWDIAQDDDERLSPGAAALDVDVLETGCRHLQEELSLLFGSEPMGAKAMRILLHPALREEEPPAWGQHTARLTNPANAVVPVVHRAHRPHYRGRSVGQRE